MNAEQKYVDLINDLYDAIKGMNHNMEELRKPNITSDQFMEIFGRIERFSNKSAAIHSEIKKLAIPKDKLLALFSKTKK
jgi:hypothetical protein